MPTPFLSLVGISEADKLKLNSYSVGDMLYYLASGSKNALGGFRTGHFIGSGMAAYGFAYLGLLFLAIALIFPLVDSQALTSVPGSFISPQISIIAIAQILTWFTMSNSESVVSLMAFLLRGFIQPVLLFALFRKLLTLIRIA